MQKWGPPQDFLTTPSTPNGKNFQKSQRPSSGLSTFVDLKEKEAELGNFCFQVCV
jgi:hypothetical protein